jgi:tRNA-splicing ligase RtcB (3'-phosphate/5'-hydroxy nucleic acid ligase)
MNQEFANNLFEELRQFYDNQGKTFPPALLQVANVATLPGIVGASVGLPDIHSGYGFAIGNTAAFDVSDEDAIVSPGGVGFDINCGVRMLRSNLNVKQLTGELKESLCDALFSKIPVGVGTRGLIELKGSEINEMIETGMPWAVERGYAWPEDLLVTEQGGAISGVQGVKVSAKARGRAGQLGTLGSGNHYVEVQAVEEIYDSESAGAMGITQIGQICVMIHCGSRGFGHQIASEFVASMQQERENGSDLNDPQLACMPISSPQGQAYLSSMAAAANFAFVNRSVIAMQVRAAFEQIFNQSAREGLDMHQVYDVAHNIATVEEHGGKRLLVHRKGSTRAFPPGHPDLPEMYKKSGQPVLVGGSMGTCSYVLTGTHEAMQLSFGSTCHGAGRAVSRSSSRKVRSPQQVLDDLAAKGISIRVAAPDSIAEEAPEAYKDVNKVVEICHAMKLSRKAFKLIPIAVIKG